MKRSSRWNCSSSCSGTFLSEPMLMPNNFEEVASDQGRWRKKQSKKKKNVGLNKRKKRGGNKRRRNGKRGEKGKQKKRLPWAATHTSMILLNSHVCKLHIGHC